MPELGAGPDDVDEDRRNRDDDRGQRSEQHDGENNSRESAGQLQTAHLERQAGRLATASPISASEQSNGLPIVVRDVVRSPTLTATTNARHGRPSERCGVLAPCHQSFIGPTSVKLESTRAREFMWCVLRTKYVLPSAHSCRSVRSPTVRAFSVARTPSTETGDSVAIVALALLVYGETGDRVGRPPRCFSLQLRSRVPRAGPDRPPGPASRCVARCRRSTCAEAIVFVCLGLIAESFVLPAVLVLGLLDGTLAVTGRGLTRGGGRGDAEAGRHAARGQRDPQRRLRRGRLSAAPRSAVCSPGSSAIQTALFVDAASFSRSRS